MKTTAQIAYEKARELAPLGPYGTRGQLFGDWWDHKLELRHRTALCALARLNLDDLPLMRWLQMPPQARVAIVNSTAELIPLGALATRIFLGEFDQVG